MIQGFGDFRWFTGVVEDRMDPLKLGRVRVRIHALHSEERIVNQRTGQGIPVKDLPWAWPLRDITDAAMDGIGRSPLGPVEGTWVCGFSRDESMNDLVVIGTWGGIPQDKPQDKEGKKGFVDPRTEGEIAQSPRYINKEENRDPGYPPDKIPMGRYPQEKFLNEPDVNRLARAEKLDQTYLKKKKDDRKRKIKTASGGTWEEKSPPYGAMYPYNHVRETESGHVIEIDDTKGAERIHVWHKSGSYYEIHPDGSCQVTTKGDRYNVTLKDDNLYAEGSINITAGKGVSVLASGGKVHVKADGTIELETSSQLIVKADAGISTVSAGPVSMISATAISMVAPLVTVNGERIP